MTHFCRLFSLQFQSVLPRKAASLNGKFISKDHLSCSFKNVYSGEAELGVECGCGGAVVWCGGGHKDNFPSLPPLRSITQSWSLHRAGRLATWHPSSPPSPGNETCDRNQPASSRPPPPVPSLLCSSPVSAAFAPSLLHQPPRRKCTYAGTHL